MEERGGDVVYRYAGKPLTGIDDLKGTAPCEEAVIGCSGLSFDRYDDSIPPPEWPRVAVNESIRKLRSAEWWVLADDPILYEYADVAPADVKILAMQQATAIIGRFAKGRRYWTVESMSKIAPYDNGHQFYSRGTVLIGAIEMLRFIGFRRFFVFGCDCYRTKAAYYYDGRAPIPLSEKHFVENQRVRGHEGEKIYVTPRLKNMIDRLGAVKRSGLWDGIEVWCVDSPHSQQDAFPKMSIDVFRDLAADWRRPKIREFESLRAAAAVAGDMLNGIGEEIESSPCALPGGERGAPKEAAPAEGAPSPDLPKRRRGRPRKRPAPSTTEGPAAVDVEPAWDDEEEVDP